MERAAIILSAVLLSLIPLRTASAESPLVSGVLRALSGVSSAVVKLLTGLIVLITVLSLVKSGLSAQLSAWFRRKTGLAGEIGTVLGTLALFLIAASVMPLLRSVIAAAVSGAGSASEMLGGGFELPDF